MHGSLFDEVPVVAAGALRFPTETVEIGFARLCVTGFRIVELERENRYINKVI